VPVDEGHPGKSPGSVLDTPTETDNQHIFCKADNYKIIPDGHRVYGSEIKRIAFIGTLTYQ
jgi:hypothetical protein